MAGYGMLLLRVTVGAIYLMQAYLALFVSTPRGVAGFIAKTAGTPMPTLIALAVIAILGVGGAMLVLGIWIRLVATANALVLVGGMVAVYLRQGVVIKGALLDAAVGRGTPAGYEYVLLLVAATVALATTTRGARGGSGAGTSGRAK